MAESTSSEAVGGRVPPELFEVIIVFGEVKARLAAHVVALLSDKILGLDDVRLYCVFEFLL